MAYFKLMKAERRRTKALSSCSSYISKLFAFVIFTCLHSDVMTSERSIMRPDQGPRPFQRGQVSLELLLRHRMQTMEVVQLVIRLAMSDSCGNKREVRGR